MNKGANLKDGGEAAISPLRTGDRARQGAFLRRIRELAVDALARMYVPAEGLFVFRLRRDGAAGLVSEGLSARYSAIALLGLAGEPKEAVEHALHGASPAEVCDRVTGVVCKGSNVGDVAVALWAATAVGSPRADEVRDRLRSLAPHDHPCPTVELSWVVISACLDHELNACGFAKQAAARLLTAFNEKSGVFSHATGADACGLRGHVSCFADFVYPIQALAQYHRTSGDARSLAAASMSAGVACALQGPQGQWWWHFDRRTGDVIERFPVYSVHQHGMGPMCLFALHDAGGAMHEAAVSKSLDWLAHSIEINGSLVDTRERVIWRKVARQEPSKLARKVQAAASYMHPALRMPGVDQVLPARAIDFECRPYELGWLLYAWPRSRVESWAER